MVDFAGKNIGRYHVVEQLGTGGMAAVYKAFDTRLERYVAIKVIIPYHQQSPDFLKRFDREAKALASLQHPNILKVHDFGEHEGAPFLVMEYIKGGTLTERMGKPTPYQEAARLTIPIAQALDYAHKQNIIHRDIKPANILMSTHGSPMLSDFGIAKLLTQEQTRSLTGAGVSIGTPEYMAPEQGQGSHVDHRADIYALGVVFYELITGRKPFQADTPMAVILKHMTEPLPRPRAYVRDLPEAVEQVIFKALAKAPRDRYQDMNAFANALTKLSNMQISARDVVPVQEIPTQKHPLPSTSVQPYDDQTLTRPDYQAAAPPLQSPYPIRPPAPSRTPPPVQMQAPKRSGIKSWMLWGAGGITILCVLVVALGLGGYALLGQPTPTKFVPAEVFATPPLEFTIAALTQPAAAPSTTPQQPQIDQTAAQPSDSAIPPVTPSDTPIPPSSTPSLPVMIVYVVGSPGYTDIYVSDEKGRSSRCVACDPDHDQAEPGWSADGQTVVFHANYRGSYDIWSVNYSGGSPSQLTTDAAADEREPDWSSDGKLVYKANPLDSARDIKGELWVLELGSAAPYSLGVQGRGPAWSPDSRSITFMSDADGKWKIYVIDIATRQVVEAATCTTNCRWPAWSPDGQWIAYNTTTAVGSTVPESIWISSQGHQEWTMLADQNNAGRPSWSSNGLVAYNTNNGIEVVDPATRSVNLLIDDSTAWAPAWSR
jgi:serine/threonine protein kinase